MSKYKEYIANLQADMLGYFASAHGTPKSQPSAPATTSELFYNVEKAFAVNIADLLKALLPRLVSPRFTRAGVVQGNCEIICHSCKMVPLRYAALDCGHLFCLECLLRDLTFDARRSRTARLGCPHCRRRSEGLSWRRSVLAQIRQTTNIHCAHCSEEFQTLQEYLTHEADNAPYFGLPSFADLSLASAND